MCYPGRVHDARVLNNSGFFLTAQENGTTFPGGQCCTVEGVQVPVLLLEDPSYPLLPWLMKPYPEGRPTNEEATFNYHLSRARVVVKKGLCNAQSKMENFISAARGYSGTCV